MYRSSFLERLRRAAGVQQQQQYSIAETIPRTTTPTAVNVPATLPASEKNAFLLLWFVDEAAAVSDVYSSPSDDVGDDVDESIGSVDGDDDDADGAAPATPTKSVEDDSDDALADDSLVVLLSSVGGDDLIRVEFADWVIYIVLTCC